MLNADGTKSCPRCQRTKLAAGNFYKSGRPNGDGYHGYCIQCAKDASTEWQKALPADARRTKNKADWEKRKQTPEYRAVQSARQKDWANRNRDHVRAEARKQTQRFKAEFPDQYRLRNAINNNTQRAKRLGLQADFSYIDWCEVLERFSHKCAFCEAGECLLDLEHLVPLSHGGHHTVGNVVPACRPCNAQKCKKPLDQFARERRISEEQLDRIRDLARTPVS